MNEQEVWNSLQRKFASASTRVVQVETAELDLARPCTILAGRNGAGKSRFLRSVADQLGDEALYVDLHALAHDLLSLTGKRTDLEEMLSEYSPMDLDEERRRDLSRVISREYEAIEWYALDLLTLGDPDGEGDFSLSHMPPLSDEVVPHFRATYKGRSYSSAEMGLGELSMHILFWILEINRDRENLVLLLDEPDAYLPPVGAEALLPRLLNLCLKRSWRLVMSSHSTAVISQAVEQQAFVRLDVGSDGMIMGTHVSSDPAVADTLLAAPPTRYVIFVEDEAACYLAKALLRAFGREIEPAAVIVWGEGVGTLHGLRKHLPRWAGSTLRYAYVPDGDQRTEISPSNSQRWPVVFLPTDLEPDRLFMAVAGDVDALASRLGSEAQELQWRLDQNEGKDPHDWVNGLASHFDRVTVYKALADLWVAKNPTESRSFWEELAAALT